jgi:cytochrome c oxidase subunit 2
MRLMKRMRAFLRNGLLFPAALLASSLSATAAWAQATEGSYAVDRQINLMPAATDHMQSIHDFHNLMLVIITGISLFVLGLLVWVMVRYNAKANPKPATWSHNTMVEVVWTLVPVVILAFIGLQSLRLLYEGDVVPDNPDVTVKATGHQWNWSYTYPDLGVEIELSEMATAEEARAAGEPRLLAVKEGGRVVVPVNKIIRVQVTAADVIHSWAVPAFGVKSDAVPGRLNETWFKANREGVFYGQCSELCGARHAFMPIAVEVVSQEKFDEWVAMKKSTASLNSASTALASR